MWPLSRVQYDKCFCLSQSPHADARRTGTPKYWVSLEVLLAMHLE